MRPLLLLLPLIACKGDDKRGDSTTPSATTPTGSTTSTTGTTTGTTNPTDLVGSDVLRFHGKVPTNILFLSIDTFRKDHVGVHGSLGLTPFLDRIAAEGVVMNDHVQCSNWTYGSTTCTLAGRTNIERGHMPRLNGNAANRPPVPAGTPFLATWLGDAGYYSAIISANDWLSARWGNTQGFVDEDKPFGMAEAVRSRGLELLDQARANGIADKWFLHLHHMEPHAAYEPPEENIIGAEYLEPWPEDLTNRSFHYAARDNFGDLTPSEQSLLEAHLRILYQGEILTIDQRLEDTWDALEAGGYLEDTLVVIWSDHGEAFWEHGFQTHAYNLTYEENDAFLIFWADNIVPGTWDEPTAAIDLVPTLLDLQGIPIPSEVTGLPIGTAPSDRPIFLEALTRTGGVQAVVKEGWKLHYNWADASVRVFDRSTDPLELVDLYDPTDAKTLELWTDLRPQVEAMAPLVVNGMPAPNWPPDLP